MERSVSARTVRQQLESLARAGVTHLPKAPPIDLSSESETVLPSKKTALDADKGGQAAHATHDADKGGQAVDAFVREALEALRPHKPTPADAPADVHRETSLFDSVDRTPALSPEERVARLAALKEQVAGCTRCPALVECRTQTVFGVGSPTARLCFVGEAPGADEDRQGEPFVGAAGQLLNRILAACKLEREEVYILNVLKCRPPGNRNPLPDEAANCRPYLEQQIEIIRPGYLCALGSVAAQALLETNLSIGKLRGRFHSYLGIPLVCTYHPAYLLRNPAAKRYVWDDMKMLMARMGVEL